MRVITGTARGKRLKEIQGMDIRPTTDRVKESLFNIIQFEIPGRQVLDLFGGTGQLAIECLSRSAESATIVDSRKEAVATIRDNLALTGLEATVLHRDSLSFLSTCQPESFHLVILDPPYESDLLEKSLQALVRFDILRKSGIIVCESPMEWEPPLLEEPYQLGKEYKYGKIKLTTFLKN